MQFDCSGHPSDNCGAFIEVEMWWKKPTCRQLHRHPDVPVTDVLATARFSSGDCGSRHHGPSVDHPRGLHHGVLGVYDEACHRQLRPRGCGEVDRVRVDGDRGRYQMVRTFTATDDAGNPTIGANHHCGRHHSPRIDHP